MQIRLRQKDRFVSKLTIVRHGQASFFAENYDRLSDLGEKQSCVLAQYWLDGGERVDRVYSGALERQRRTAEVVGETYRKAGVEWPAIEILPELNEYPADAIMGGLLPGLCEREQRFRDLKEDFEQAGEGQDRYRTFHRLLEAVVAVWASGNYEANEVEPWSEFRDRVRGALRTITSVEGHGQHIVVFTSGGPVGVSVQTVLEAPDIKAMELNWRVRNCSLTGFTFSNGRIALDVFNAVPHLSDPTLLTYR